MEFNKAVSNPMLVGSIELMKAEDTPDHRNMFIGEMMKARFLAPAIVDPAPETDENGKFRIAQGAKVQFPMLSTQDGKHFFMAFTDAGELKKWKDEENQQTFAMTFDDYASMLLRKDAQGNMSPALGFVINPYSSNVFISKEMTANLMASKIAQLQAKQGRQGQPGQPIPFRKPVQPAQPGKPEEKK